MLPRPDDIIDVIVLIEDDISRFDLMWPREKIAGGHVQDIILLSAEKILFSEIAVPASGGVV